MRGRRGGGEPEGKRQAGKEGKRKTDRKPNTIKKKTKYRSARLYLARSTFEELRAAGRPRKETEREKDREGPSESR